MARAGDSPPPAGSPSMRRLVLASASPRRRELIALLQIPFAVAATDVDETPQSGESGDQLARRLARAKALAGTSTRAATPAAAAPDRLALGADTMVILDGAVLGKPAGADEARAMLRALRGRAHRVITALALATPEKIAWDAAAETVVEMRRYGEDELERYVDVGGPFDKAGGYAIQDPSFRPVARISGCYPNVVGLPLCELLRGLRTVGLDGAGPPEADLVPPCPLCDRARALYEDGRRTKGG